MLNRIITIVCGALLLWAAGAVPVAAAPPVALPVSPLVATPGQISADVPLGQRGSATLLISNTGDAPVTPLVYEAEPAPSIAAVPRAIRGPQRVPVPQQPQRLDDRLVARMRAAPAESIDFLVYLQDQADLSGAYAIGDWTARGQYVYDTLTRYAASSQAPLRQWLTQRGVANQPFWIVNALVVHGNLADAQQLAGRADVAAVRSNTTASLPPVASAVSASQCSPDKPTNPICWNVRQIGADRAWQDFGVTGRGVVLGSIDSGVRFDHPALVAQYRGTQGTTFDHNYNWFDPQQKLLAPQDTTGHGTHTMGLAVAVGNGTLDQPAVGIAPGASWIAAQGCTSSCADADVIASAQWMLAPTRLDGTQPRPDLRPMVINNSWSGAGGRTWYDGYIAAWRAAGIFPVFAAGNVGQSTSQICGSVGSPGDDPNVIAVGATDGDDRITPYSLFGPNREGQIKPDLVAPGSLMLSTWNQDGASYYMQQGTSMAAPHVAGLVALLWSANPALIGDYDATAAIMRRTAQPIYDTRCESQDGGAANNVYGYGRIDAYAAVSQARVDVPWLQAAPASTVVPANGQVMVTITLNASRVTSPGSYHARLQIFANDLGHAPVAVDVLMRVLPAAGQVQASGRVLDRRTAMPVQAVVSLDNGVSMPTNADGSYTLTTAPGVHTLAASAPSYLLASATVTITKDGPLPDILLQPDQARISAAPPLHGTPLSFGETRTITIPITNTGTLPLYYQVDEQTSRMSVWRSDEPGGPASQWIELPATASVLRASGVISNQVPLGFAFPFFDNVYTQTLVTARGALVFGPFAARFAPLGGCLPTLPSSIPFVAPLGTELDPSRGGQVRYGTVDGAFVVNYEDVALQSSPAAARNTFQVQLLPDGQVRLSYRHLDVLVAGVGPSVQAQADTVPLGCGATAALTDGLTIALRPEPPLRLWFTAITGKGVVPPGQTRMIMVRVAWLRSVHAQPYRATLLVTSSDPQRSMVQLPIDATMLPAPFDQWLPLTH